MLPEEPRCAWLMQPEQSSNALAAAKRHLGTHHNSPCKEASAWLSWSSAWVETNTWRVNVNMNRYNTRLQADAMTETCGRGLHSNSDDVMWSLDRLKFGVLVFHGTHSYCLA
ncbi:hypothetical protein WJX82_001485 [Trebouxia sp. C0006]